MTWSRAKKHSRLPYLHSTKTVTAEQLERDKGREGENLEEEVAQKGFCVTRNKIQEP